MDLMDILLEINSTPKCGGFTDSEIFSKRKIKTDIPSLRYVPYVNKQEGYKPKIRDNEAEYKNKKRGNLMRLNIEDIILFRKEKHSKKYEKEEL